jgi:replicative DNA helicase
MIDSNDDILNALKSINQGEQIEDTSDDEDYNFTLGDTEDDSNLYPPKLADTTLERRYIGLILNEIKSISVYYFLSDECYFADENMLNIYKKILFTDGEKYAPVKAKEGYTFAKETQDLYQLKNTIKDEFYKSEYKLDETYTELKKLFVIRKSYLDIPVKEIQPKIVEILDYELYDKMTVEDVKNTVEQVTATEKFKRAVLNQDLTDFLVKGDNVLTNGLELPFPILTSVFKGIRKGETSAFAMPSNSGKSRFIINLAANIALVHKKKVLIISNEMSEEKMKLCLITTIVNNPEIQKLHGQKLHVSENELLAFKFRPTDPNDQTILKDENGYILRNEGESQEVFAKRLISISEEFVEVLKVTNWFNEKLKNSIYFIDITDHTNDELKKVIMNYYYKEKIEYVFYDTLKTDIDNIGNGEELKKTATILSNLAQNFDMYIGSTLQLAETSTDPINLSVNDMAVSRTVKEVLDTLCLFKQIHTENLGNYQYSLNETDEEVYELEKFKDPDVRYYSCVVDKNRAGAKPKLLFRLNLAYNRWEELGYLRLKQQNAHTSIKD